MNKFITFALTVSLGVSGASLLADNIFLTTADSEASATTSFNSANGWANGAAPSAGNSYTVALGEDSGMFLPTVAATFAGDSLQIGTDDVAGFLSSSTFASWTIPSLILKKGLWRIPTTGNMSKIASITVESTSDDPFVIKLGNNTRATTGIFYGSEDSVVCFARDDSVTTLSDLAPNFDKYSGKIILDGVKFGSLGIQIRSMFGAASGFAADRIVLKNGAGLGQTGYNNKSYNNAKLGITIDATGGSLFKCDHASPTIYFPIVGGPLTVVDSAWIFANRLATTDLNLKSVSRENPAAVFLNGSTLSVDRIVMHGGYNSGNLGKSGNSVLYVADAIVEKPVSVDMSGDYGKSYLRICYPASTNFNITMHNNSVLDPNPAASSHTIAVGAAAESITIRDFTYDGGVLKLDFDADGAKLECLKIDGKISGVSETFPLQFQSAIWPSKIFTSAQPLIIVKKSELALTHAMLDISGYSFDDPFKIVNLEIVEDGDYYVAMIGPKDAEVITLVKGDSASAAETSFNGCGENWSDGKVPHLAPYRVALGTNDTDALYFPSVSAEFAGTELAVGNLESGATGRVDLAIGGITPTYTLDRFTLNKGVMLLRPTNPNYANSITFAGKMIVNSPEAEPFVFERIGYGYEQININNLVADKGTAMCFISRDPSVNNFTMSFRINAGVSSFKGKMIFDNAFFISDIRGLTYEEFVPDAITLKNGAAITPSGYSNSWATDDAKKIGIVIGEGGGGFSAKVRIGGPTIRYNNVITGGNFFHSTGGVAEFYGSMTLDQVRIFNKTPYTGKSGSSYNVGQFVVFGTSSLTFEEGVVFEGREQPTEFSISNATLQVGSNLPENARLVIGADGVFKINNNGDKCQRAQLGDAVIGTGSTLYFDVDAENNTCDSIYAVGNGSKYECTRDEKLKIVVNPVDAAYAPSDGRTFAFDLLSIPESAGKIHKKSIDLSFSAESCIDHLRVVIIHENGMQTVRLTDRNYGTRFMVQ